MKEKSKMPTFGEENGTSISTQTKREKGLPLRGSAHSRKAEAEKNFKKGRVVAQLERTGRKNDKPNP